MYFMAAILKIQNGGLSGVGANANINFWIPHALVIPTSSSAAAERPREPLSQLKSCQLLHNCTKNHI